MTNKEAIFCEKSYIGETNCIDCKYYGTETCQSRESHRMAVKALKQVSALNKIRVEIEQAADKQFQIAMGIADLNERYTNIQMENAYRHILNIIDKYKSENSEMTE